MSSHSFGAIPIRPRRDSLDMDDDALNTLMEDYIRVSHLQISLKKRINSVLKRREEVSKDKEREAYESWVQSQEQTQTLQGEITVLKEKMKKIESDEWCLPFVLFQRHILTQLLLIERILLVWY
jgi:chromosome segregation ATPase